MSNREFNTLPTGIKTSTGPANPVFVDTEPLPVLLIAHAAPQTTTTDRVPIGAELTVGRSSKCGLTIRDDKISNHHFTIRAVPGGFALQDLGSSNGTFVDGMGVVEVPILADGQVIRAGDTLFVFHADGRAILQTSAFDSQGIAGRFHVEPLLRTLKEAICSPRAILLAGPSGSGKELCAKALYAMRADRSPNGALVVQSAANFGSEQEAKTSLFGVETGVFTDVKKRDGLIHRAHQGLLFLDELPVLSVDVQRSLLRVVEDHLVARIGQSAPQSIDVKFVFASNAPPPCHGLAEDLCNRLFVVHVPSLRARKADIPSIFDAVLRQALKTYALTESIVFPLLTCGHYEILTTESFASENVRGLKDLADRIAGRIAAGDPPESVLSATFAQRFEDNPVVARLRRPSTPSHSPYEQNKDQILAVYQRNRANISATVRELDRAGIPATKRWLAEYLKKWGVR